MPSSRSKAYKSAGVDIESGNSLVSKIKSFVTTTHIPGVKSDIGGFGGLFKPDISNMSEPLLVASTDGVGTKVKLACAFNKHDTIGIDLVAMSVNDILVQGAKPLFFLDYFSTSKLDVELAATVIKGIADGCKISGCALLGGETAEMPDMYSDGEYDLAGFCLGLVDNAKIVEGSYIKVSDVVIGISSSGAHANGYSLIRKLLEESNLTPSCTFPGTEKTVAEVLLEPTTIYADCVRNILRDFTVNGMVHVTGGGFYDNIPRVLPQQLKANIKFGSWDMLPVFDWIKSQGNLSWQEMLQIFNCSIGYIMIVNESQAEEIINRINALQLNAYIIGNIGLMDKADTEKVSIEF